MARAGEEYAVAVWIQVSRLGALVESFSEIGIAVFPCFLVVAFQPVRLLRQPIRLIGASLGNEVDSKAVLTEDIEGVQSFCDEEPGLLGFRIEGSVGRGNSDQGTARRSHFFLCVEERYV